MRFNALSVFPILLVCLIARVTPCSGEDAHNLARLGGKMSAEDKSALEEQLEKNPDDVDSRTKVLGYYFLKGRQDPGAQAARQRHVLWLIENVPESEVLGLPYAQLNKIIDREGYERAKQAWLSVIEKSPDKLSILKNASAFFLLSDRKVSEELLLKGQALDANDPSWAASLGQLYSLDLMLLPTGPKRKETAEKALQQYKLAYDRSDKEEADSLLSSLAKTAFAAGLNDEAKTFAEKMLDEDAAGWNQGNRIHHGNLILGQIALSDGNIDEAKSRLLLAGKTSGSPQLNSFGPNMQLAKELLQKGEPDVVLEYFELCKKFWKSGNRKLDEWKKEVKANQIPEFGGNLAY